MKQKFGFIKIPISNDHGVVTMADLLAEVQRQFDVEMNCKNSCYHEMTLPQIQKACNEPAFTTSTH